MGSTHVDRQDLVKDLAATVDHRAVIESVTAEPSVRFVRNKNLMQEGECI